MIKDSYGNSRFFGIYRGVVYDNVDPLGRARVRVLVPQLLASFPTEWAWPVGNAIGVPPIIGEGVWVMFEGGDPSYPLWVGKFVPDSPDSLLTIAALPAVSEPTAVRWSPVFKATGLSFTGRDETYPTFESRYVRHGQLVTFNIKIDLSTVTNFGTGQFKVDLPFEPIASAGNHFSAWAWVNPALPANELNGHVQMVADHLPGSRTLDLHWLKETTASPKPVIESLLVQGTPVTLTTSSEMYVNGTYICVA